MSLFIGTSGWDYPEWRGHFYPQDLPRTKFLEYYSRALTACELNATFYGRQTEKSVARWASTTPDGFAFSAKAHMRLTYTKQMAPNDESREYIDQFLRSLSGLGEKLAVVLLQFPAFRERDDAGLAKLLEVLPSRCRYAFEFRHASWDAPDVRSTLEEANAALCYGDESPDAPEALPRGRFAYVRLRGTAYTNEQQSAWSRLLQAEAGERDVFVFARHKGIEPADQSAGVGLASRLAAQLEGI